MSKNENMMAQLQRYYSLWKDCNAMYENWAKKQCLSSNGVFVLYSFYEDDGNCTQKTISEKWNIPKQTVNTILKDFLNCGYVEMFSMLEDKRNKLVRLTESGRNFAQAVIGKLQEKEIYVIKKMGFKNIKSLNDNLEFFIRIFREGGFEKDDS